MFHHNKHLTFTSPLEKHQKIKHKNSIVGCTDNENLQAQGDLQDVIFKTFDTTALWVALSSLAISR